MMLVAETGLLKMSQVLVTLGVGLAILVIAVAVIAAMSLALVLMILVYRAILDLLMIPVRRMIRGRATTQEAPTQEIKHHMTVVATEYSESKYRVTCSCGMDEEYEASPDEIGHITQEHLLQ